MDRIDVGSNLFCLLYRLVVRSMIIALCLIFEIITYSLMITELVIAFSPATELNDAKAHYNHHTHRTLIKLMEITCLN